MNNDIGMLNTAIDNNYPGIEYDSCLGYVQVFHPVSLEIGKPFIVCEGHYVNGVKHGKWVYRDYLGRILAEGCYSNDLLDGEWAFNCSDGMSLVVGFCQYENGKRVTNNANFPEADADIIVFLDLEWY